MSFTFIILIITVAVSILSFSQKEYFYKFQFNPSLVHNHKQWYRLFSHAFIHADWMHLIFNMYVLYGFGRNTEMHFFDYFGNMGPTLFLLLYVGGILFSALPALKKHKDNSYYNAVGASGAVSAVLFSSILFEPMSEIGILFIPFRIPAFIFGGLYLAFEWYMNKKSNDNIAHDAHLWGGVFGIVFTILLNPKIGLNFIFEIQQKFF